MLQLTVSLLTLLLEEGASALSEPESKSNNSTQLPTREGTSHIYT